jgi:cytoskeletal protein RodZ
MVKRVAEGRTANKAEPEIMLEDCTPPEMIGAVLQAARIRLGMTIDDVSNATKVSPRFLESIDAARFDDFIRPVYAIGFTRAYARAVSLPSDIAANKVRELLGPRDGVQVVL